MDSRSCNQPSLLRVRFEVVIWLVSGGKRRELGNVTIWNLDTWQAVRRLSTER